jgi:hypothetical protein
MKFLHDDLLYCFSFPFAACAVFLFGHAIVVTIPGSCDRAGRSLSFTFHFIAQVPNGSERRMHLQGSATHMHARHT